MKDELTKIEDDLVSLCNHLRYLGSIVGQNVGLNLDIVNKLGAEWIKYRKAAEVYSDKRVP